MSGREGAALAEAVAQGEDLTEVERLRVVLVMKDAQIDRLASRIGKAIVAMQSGERVPKLIEILRGEDVEIRRPTDDAAG